ncbi:MAG TPA: pyridoxamine 5'-phosphate oxidase family protein [Acidimicrobiia bacterium]|jgi:general stress protein 26|nr:pyridoxamine 5'-phosphate oxidase family protein [Acidimicrobiia bacterium]
MSTPTTALDARFSAPDASPTSWADTVTVLESAQLFWLTTVRADGRPHVTPLVAVWVDDAVHFATGETEQKALNLRANSHVILTTGTNDWERGLDVVVEGEAVRNTDDATLRRLADAFGTKWDGQWQYEARDGAFFSPTEAGGGAAGADRAALVFSVAPTKVLAFGKGTFAQTRHRF